MHIQASFTLLGKNNDMMRGYTGSRLDWTWEHHAHTINSSLVNHQPSREVPNKFPYKHCYITMLMCRQWLSWSMIIQWLSYLILSIDIRCPIINIHHHDSVPIITRIQQLELPRMTSSWVRSHSSAEELLGSPNAIGKPSSFFGCCYIQVGPCLRAGKLHSISETGRFHWTVQNWHPEPTTFGEDESGGICGRFELHDPHETRANQTKGWCPGKPRPRCAGLLPPCPACDSGVFQKGSVQIETRNII